MSSSGTGLELLFQNAPKKSAKLLQEVFIGSICLSFGGLISTMDVLLKGYPRDRLDSFFRAWMYIRVLCTMIQIPMRSLMLFRVMRARRDTSHDSRYRLSRTLASLMKSKEWRTNHSVGVFVCYWFATTIPLAFFAAESNLQDNATFSYQVLRMSLMNLALMLVHVGFSLFSLHRTISTIASGDVNTPISGSDECGGASIEEINATTSLTSASTCDPAEICVICLSEMCFGEKLRQLKCQHRYHAECAQSWLLRRKTCPLCIRSIVRKQD